MEARKRRARRYISFEGFDRVARIDYTRTAPQRYESTGDGRIFGTSERQISNELDLRDLESKRGESICSGHYTIRKVPSEMEGYSDFWEVSYDGDHPAYLEELSTTLEEAKLCADRHKAEMLHKGRNASRITGFTHTGWVRSGP